MKNWMVLVFVAILLVACGSDDGPPPSPEGALLVFPEQDSECTTGISVSETLSQVTFEWQPADNTDQYTLTVIHLNTNVPQTISTANTSAVLSIEKGAPFSWSVLSSNSDSDETATSASWLFYNEGSQITYPPFPAQVQFPESGSTVLGDENNQLLLSWMGSDVEDDIVTFDIYLSESNPPETLLATTDAETTQVLTDVVSGTTVYWRIVTTDAEGNSSDSGVFDFRVL